MRDNRIRILGESRESLVGHIREPQQLLQTATDNPSVTN